MRDLRYSKNQYKLIRYVLIVEKIKPTAMPPCQGKPTHGPCDMRIDGYTFDTDSKKCKKFLGGGCGMTGNGFRSMEECQSKCSK